MTDIKTSPETHLPAERAARRLAACVGVGALLGLLVGGIGGRLAMFALIRLSPEASGTTSDDGFTMGQFTASGTFSLIALGTILGVLGGGIYFVLRGLMIGPRWFQILSIAGGAAVVVGAMLVHVDGVDFTLLDAGFAIAFFVAIPGVYAALLTVLIERWLAPGSRFLEAPKKFALLPLIACIPLAPLFVMLALAWVAGMGLRELAPTRKLLSQPWMPWVARLALTLIFVAAASNLVSDVATLT